MMWTINKITTGLEILMKNKAIGEFGEIVISFLKKQEAEISRLRSVLKDCVEELEEHPYCEWDDCKGRAYCTDCDAMQGRHHEPSCRWKLTLDKAKAVLKGEVNE